MLAYMGYEGIKRSYKEYDVNDTSDWLYMKSAGKAIWYGSGIPGVIDMGWEASTGEEHWWFGDRWSCPNCELVTMPSEVLRSDGQTYKDYAAGRMKVYDDRREVRDTHL